MSENFCILVVKSCLPCAKEIWTTVSKRSSNSILFQRGGIFRHPGGFFTQFRNEHIFSHIGISYFITSTNFWHVNTDLSRKLLDNVWNCPLYICSFCTNTENQEFSRENVLCTLQRFNSNWILVAAGLHYVSALSLTHTARTAGNAQLMPFCRVKNMCWCNFRVLELRKVNMYSVTYLLICRVSF